jgi:hypothetical protein
MNESINQSIIRKRPLASCEEKTALCEQVVDTEGEQYCTVEVELQLRATTAPVEKKEAYKTRRELIVMGSPLSTAPTHQTKFLKKHRSS